MHTFCKSKSLSSGARAANAATPPSLRGNSGRGGGGQGSLLAKGATERAVASQRCSHRECRHPPVPKKEAREGEEECSFSEGCLRTRGGHPVGLAPRTSGRGTTSLMTLIACARPQPSLMTLRSHSGQLGPVPAACGSFIALLSVLCALSCELVASLCGFQQCS